jgi:RHS repeat-associated protein
VSLPSYTATLCEQYQYDAWGQIISSGQYNSPYTDFKYQGKERENNLDYFGARYFDSASISGGSPMRWISPDPVTSNVYDPQSLNKYTYVRNDPVNNTDPDGRWVFDAVSEMQYSLMASLPFVNGVSGAQNPFDSYYFQYMMYQAQFNAYQYQMYLAQQSVQQYQMSVSAQAGVSSYNETVTMQNTANGIDRAKAALAIPSCAAIFGFDSFSGTGVADPSSVLNNLLNGGSSLFIIAYDPIPLMQNINGTTGYTANASTQMIGTSQSMATGATNNIALITINTDMTTPFNNMDVNYQAATILHELAHAFNIVYGAGTSKIFNDDQTVPNNTSVSRGNQDYIQSQCGL